jgi:glutamate-1-semialdehyde 2,1-aminomutase
LGARFWDVDGNEYIDWVSGIGAIILGYCDPVVDDAVRDQMICGTVYSVNHELEIELAEELIRTIPSAEMVRYAKTGGEACAMAVRIARGATGRDRVLFCGYHGWHDWYLAANLSDEAALAPHLFPGIDPTGVPRVLAGTAIPFRYGDLTALGERLDRHRGEVAAVVMEPLRSELPPTGYLEGVKALCREHGAVLVFDEVTSGFRLAVGGAQEYLGVTPDVTVLGKAISNGYPMAAVVGRREVMEPAGRMFISSTYWGDTIGLRAALTTIRELKRRNVPESLHRLGADIAARMNRAAADAGLAVRCAGTPVHPALRFPDAAPDETAVLTTLYIQEMAKRGCHGYASFYLNAAQGAAELDQTETAAREVFAILAAHRSAGSLASLLECDPARDAFRRMVS